MRHTGLHERNGKIRFDVNVKSKKLRHVENARCTNVNLLNARLKPNVNGVDGSAKLVT